jgi:hypothetical protein
MSVLETDFIQGIPENIDIDIKPECWIDESDVLETEYEFLQEEQETTAHDEYNLSSSNKSNNDKDPLYFENEEAVLDNNHYETNICNKSLEKNEG